MLNLTTTHKKENTMKTSLITIALILAGASSAFANTVKCFANVETKAGSNNYDKNIYSEDLQVENRSILHVLLSDGTLLRADKNTPPEEMAKVQDGDKVFNISMYDGKINVMTGNIARKPGSDMKFTNLSLAGNSTDASVYLMANGLFVNCSPSVAK
jgi:hypothetical protein